MNDRPTCADSWLQLGVTGNVLPDDVAHYKRCGADWVFCKPVRIPDLEAIWTDYGVIGGPGMSSEVETSATTQCTSRTNEMDHEVPEATPAA